MNVESKCNYHGYLRNLACILFYVGISFLLPTVHAEIPQSTPPKAPPYTPLVWDQDWTYLRDPAVPRDPLDKLHYVKLNASGEDYISFSGQIRERGEYFDYPAFGAQPADNGYLQQRYIVGSDLHLHQSFRLFTQLSSSLINGRDGGPRTAVDEQKLSFNQGFIDYTPLHEGDASFTLRAGRQLVSLGSTRLVAIGAGLNVEQPFDGFRLTLNALDWKLQGLAVRPVSVSPGYMASAPDHTQELWGLYATHPFPLPHANIDLYYLGYDHAKGLWLHGVGREQRETFGLRLYAQSSTWYYDWEFTPQIGRFGSGDIRAWGIGTNTGYHFAATKFQPRIELDAGALSGDSNLHNKTLGTFNALFPNGSYLSQALLIGPYNVILARPKLQLNVTRSVTFNPNLEMLWRESTQDGTYGIVGYPNHAASLSSARYIGAQIDSDVDWAINRHTTFSVDYEHFFPGQFLKQTPPNRSVNFIAPQIIFNF
jgi:hypothetical protein